MPPSRVQPQRQGHNTYIPLQLHFDFVIKTQPKYIPGTGPPLAPISIMPVHDKDGIILDFISLNGVPQYIVGYEDSHLQVGVQPKDILDWVSPLTFENYEFEQTKLREKEEEDKKRAKALASAARDKRRDQKLQTITQSRGRKRKQPLSPDAEDQRPSPQVMGRAIRAEDAPTPSGPGRRRKEEGTQYTSPQAARISSQTILSTPSKGRGLAELISTESEKSPSTDDEDAIDFVLNRQLGASSASHGDRRSSFQHPSHRSNSSSPEPVPAILPKPSEWSSSKKRRSLDNAAVASSSSREALKTFEKLQKSSSSKPGAETPRKSQKTAQRYSMFAPGSSKPTKAVNFHRADYDLDSGSDDRIPNRGDDCGDEDEDDDGDEEEWEIKGILDEQYMEVEGKNILHYLIEWAGDWDPTWEVEENVSEAAVVEWERQNRKKPQKKMHKEKKFRADELSIENGRKNKGKQIAVDSDSQGDEDNYRHSSHGQQSSSGKSKGKFRSALTDHSGTEDDHRSTLKREKAKLNSSAQKQSDYDADEYAPSSSKTQQKSRKSRGISSMDGDDSSGDDDSRYAFKYDGHPLFSSDWGITSNSHDKSDNGKSGGGDFQTMTDGQQRTSFDAAMESDPDSMFITDKGKGNGGAPGLHRAITFEADDLFSEDELDDGSVIL